jgi:flagellar L-ring protein FlgH
MTNGLDVTLSKAKGLKTLFTAFADQVRGVNIMTGNFLRLCIAILLCALTGCATSQRIAAPVAPETPAVQIQDANYIVPVNKSASPSLYREGSSRNFFQDLRAYQVGDLVTVNIVETSSASKNAGTKTGRNSSIDAGIPNALGWETKLKNLTSFGNKNVHNAFDNSSLFNSSMKNSFDGSGTTSREESMTAYITVRVIQVLSNGNLFIQGTREVTVNNETQHIILSGTIRPSDISPDNSIISSYIGDAKIQYTGSGVLSDKQRVGWLTRIIDYVWPF